jgi:hypothetical protein
MREAPRQLEAARATRQTVRVTQGPMYLISKQQPHGLLSSRQTE